MSTVTAEYQGEQSYVDRNAWAARLVVRLGGEYLQFVTVGVSGRGLRAINASQPSSGLLSNLARASQQRILLAVEEGGIPSANPTKAFELWLDDPHTVRSAAAALDPPLSAGDIAWTTLESTT